MPLKEILKYSAKKLVPILSDDDALWMASKFVPGTYARGTLMGRVKTGVAAVQSLASSGGPGSGTFTLSFRGFTTAALAYNATAAAVQAALRALPSIGGSNVTCTGGAVGTAAVVITFAATLAGASVEPITVTTSFDTGAAAITVTTVGLPAGACKASLSGASDGSQNVLGPLMFDIVVDANGGITLGDATPGEFGDLKSDAPVYFQGIFRVGDLVGVAGATMTPFRYLIGDGTGSDDMVYIR